MRAILQDALGIAHIRDDEDAFDLGVTSKSMTQLIIRLREDLGVELSVEDFYVSATIADVVKLIEQPE